MPRHSNDSREISQEDVKFLRPNAHTKKLYGDLRKHVGQFASVGDFNGSEQGLNAQLEGDDIGNFNADDSADYRQTVRNDGVTK